MARPLVLLSLTACLTTAGLVARFDPAGLVQPASRSTADSSIAPPALQNVSRVPHIVEVSLTAAPARLALIDGKVTQLFAYNGRTPGPTLDVHEGDSVIVHFRNELQEPTVSASISSSTERRVAAELASSPKPARIKRSGLAPVWSSR